MALGGIMVGVLTALAGSRFIESLLYEVTLARSGHFRRNCSDADGGRNCRLLVAGPSGAARAESPRCVTCRVMPTRAAHLSGALGSVGGSDTIVIGPPAIRSATR